MQAAHARAPMPPIPKTALEKADFLAGPGGLRLTRLKRPSDAQQNSSFVSTVWFRSHERSFLSFSDRGASGDLFVQTKPGQVSSAKLLRSSSARRNRSARERVRFAGESAGSFDILARKFHRKDEKTNGRMARQTDVFSRRKPDSMRERERERERAREREDKRDESRATRPRRNSSLSSACARPRRRPGGLRSAIASAADDHLPRERRTRRWSPTWAFARWRSCRRVREQSAIGREIAALN